MSSTASNERRASRTSTNTLTGFRCMECLNVFPTWTQLTKHVDLTAHTLPRCSQCPKMLKCYGPTKPSVHEDISKHKGFYGLYYTKSDYLITSQMSQLMFNVGNFFTGIAQCNYTCVCGTTYLSGVDIANHLRQEHGCASLIPDLGQCRLCGFESTLADVSVHLKVCLKTVGKDVAPTILYQPVKIEGFSPSVFLSFQRPLIPPEYNANSGKTNKKVTTSPFMIAYQCQDCNLLFSSLEKITTHAKALNHMRLLPYFFKQMPDEEEHPTGAQSLEVLVDITLAESKTLMDVPPKKAEKNVYSVFQCPSEQCMKVFSFYGDLVEHLLETRHDETSNILSSAELTCRVKFTASQLETAFGFVRCDYCSKPLPRQHLELHKQLCSASNK
ncbi:hypothetical protein AGDE_12838 [Angomonas deanei]|nr:hypothetical protein AGDE_12838 [Angomonas deanei]|eukprot:EPY23399.1 hypothetical protein AGDE_12838 [Angomonas deanei]